MSENSELAGLVFCEKGRKSAFCLLRKLTFSLVFLGYNTFRFEKEDVLQLRSVANKLLTLTLAIALDTVYVFQHIIYSESIFLNLLNLLIA